MRVKSRIGIESAIVILFIILPFIDMLNGMFRGLPIGTVYKLFLCLVLFMSIMIRGNVVHKKTVLILFSFILYLCFSIGINIVIFEGNIITMDYPIKLLFNIILFLLLLENCDRKYIAGNDLYRILDGSSWIMIACYLIPYVLGVGNNVYVGELGYKGFFIAQNELNLIVVVMTFFLAFKLTNIFSIKDVIKLGLLILCGMLLNTKTTIIACLIALIIWLITILKKSNFKVKMGTIVLVCFGGYLLNERILNSVSGAMMRYKVLQNKYYSGSVLTSVLSGRDYFVKDAWSYLNEKGSVFRFIFGNGFCSNILIEMDIFDMFFYLGLIGAIGSVLFLIWILKRSLKNCKNDRNIIRPLSFVVVCALLILAGHVLFMSMSGYFFVIYCCFLMYYQPLRTSRKVAAN